MSEFVGIISKPPPPPPTCGQGSPLLHTSSILEYTTIMQFYKAMKVTIVKKTKTKMMSNPNSPTYLMLEVVK
jgi:hypothetical protein